MSHVFISYSHQDMEYTEKLERALRERGFDCWRDAEIRPGEGWQPKIRRKVETCAAFLVVVTPHSVESLRVLDELEWATAASKPVFPLLLSGKPIRPSIHHVVVEGYVLPPGPFYSKLAEAMRRNETRLAMHRERGDAEFERLREHHRSVHVCDRCDLPWAHEAFSGPAVVLLLGVPVIGGALIRHALGWWEALAFAAIAVILVLGLAASREDVFKQPQSCPHCGARLRRPFKRYTPTPTPEPPASGDAAAAH